MTARTRKATAKSTPARKTAAKKATAKRSTGTGGTPDNRPRARKTTPKLALVKDKPEPSTVVDIRKPLPVRRRRFVGPMGPNEQAAIRAALDSARLALPVPVITWNGSTAQLTDGTLLIHNPGPDRLFTAHIACRHGAIHGWPISSGGDLKEARGLTRACERRHSTPTVGDLGTQLDWDKAISRGIRPTTRLAEGLKVAKKATADTQPLSTAEICEHIARQLADDDTAKEHPQP